MRTRRFSVVSAVMLVLVLLVAPTVVSQRVVINEVAWAGTAASPHDEWIELHNISDEPVDLTGWTLVFGEVTIHLGDVDGATVEVRNVTIEPNGFFLLERSDDNTVFDIEAALIYKGTLSNKGMTLRLFNADGVEEDTANSGQEGWVAGIAIGDDLRYASMERIDPLGPDIPANWRTNDGVIRSGLDADEEAINGTPGMKNSATIIAETTPVVKILTPADEGEEISGLFTITWTATDPDGPSDQLHIYFFLSHDGGTNWEVLAEGLANEGEYLWDTTILPDGENYLLKVIVRDGADLFGEATSQIFSIVNTD